MMAGGVWFPGDIPCHQLNVDFDPRYACCVRACDTFSGQDTRRGFRASLALAVAGQFNGMTRLRWLRRDQAMVVIG
jgi:hypothetical protein